MPKIREPAPPESEEQSIETSEEEGSDDEPIQSKIHQNTQSSEDEDEDDDEGSDSDSNVRIKKFDSGTKSTADNLPRSVAASSAKKPKSKTETALPGAKRDPEEELETKETKKSKKNPGSTVDGVNNNSETKAINDDSKKQLFQRIWSEEDEIVILNGMIDYSAKKKADPVADFGALLEFIKKSLHIEVTKTQLQDKVRRLKKKFLNNSSKEKNGKELCFLKPHDQKIYELSKRIWGRLSTNYEDVGDERVHETPKVSGSVVRKSRSKNEVEDKEMNDNVVVFKTGSDSSSSSLCYSSVSEWILNDGAKMVEREKREEMEEKWKHIRKQEVEVFLKRTEFMLEHTKLVLEAMDKSEH